jgi:hypothetical protein
MNLGEDCEAASVDDPKRLIEQAVAMGSEFPGPAEDLVLSWMLSLAPEADAPAAARRLLERHGAHWPEGPEERPIGRLRRLLQQTAEATSSRSRRRGGASGRPR